MRFHPTRIYWSTIPAFAFLMLCLILGCSKDPDIISDAKFYENQKEVTPEEGETSEESTEETTSETTEETAEETTEETTSETTEEESDAGMEEGFEARTTTFPPTDDAYLQSGKGYNETLMRLEEGSRTSYLLFDLSPIEAIGGYITDATFRFTIMTDGGDGEIQVYQGLEGEWDEAALDFNNAPESDILLGQINDTYVAGSTQEIVLSAADMTPGKTTLILFHANGNDLAIASKEHPSKAFPKLVVTYNAPEEADPITVADPTSGTAGEEEETGSGSTENQAPQAVVNATPVNGQAPLEVSFEGKDSSDDTAIASYAWDFKDGSTSTSINPTHTYTEPGTYNASLLVTDGNGLTDEAIITITVQEGDNQAPVAKASASVTSGEAPLDVQFSANESTDDKGIVRYYWDFGTNDPSSAKNPSRTFTEAGEYSVTLTVTDAEGLTSTDNLTITVTGSSSTNNQSPVARISANPTSGPAPLTVSFDATASTDDSGIVSYSWDFGNTETGNGQTTQNTFNTPGTYTTTLTVTDDQGVTGTATISITVESSSGGGSSGGSGGGGGSAPPGYYVTPSGSAYASGLSESAAWSIEHAFAAAKAGDIVYVKAGNYGNKQLLISRGGSSGNPIKFIGYRSIPGDVNSSGGSTFNYGQQVNASNMPLLNNPGGSGDAITIRGDNIYIENFQINGYTTGVQSNSGGSYLTLKNVIVTNVGRQSGTAYDGYGFAIRGNNSRLENCFVHNATAEAYDLFDADNSVISYCKAYSDNTTNPTDYYFLLTGGTNNSVIEHSYAERARGLSHGGHGFDIKDLGENNIVRNSTAKGTNFELNFTGVRFNTFENCRVIGYGTSSGEWHARVLIANGANNNLIRNMQIENTWSAIFLNDNDDGYVGPGGDRDAVSLGYDNTFDGLDVNNTERVFNIGGAEDYSAVARNYTIRNSEFQNFNIVAVVNLKAENFRFENSTFRNGNELYFLGVGQYAPYSSFSATWVNCQWFNVNFTPPN